MGEKDIIEYIDGLVAEERDLRARSTLDGLVDEERARLREVEIRLDQCWDLLRQSRALTEFGDDPSKATVRPAGEVEDYRS